MPRSRRDWWRWRWERVEEMLQEEIARERARGEIGERRAEAFELVNAYMQGLATGAERDPGVEE